MAFDYNTQRTKLVLPEYGRNIQRMVEYLKTIEDREERNKAARFVIAVMGNMNPHLRDISDFKHKLWDHLAIMANFDLDIDAPYDLPNPTLGLDKPNKVDYPSGDIKYKHYGRTIELMIKRAAQYPDGPEKETLIEFIANHMKKSYLTWNREVIEDEIIFNDLTELSDGKIRVNPDMKLNTTKDLLQRNKRKRTSMQKKRYNN